MIVGTMTENVANTAAVIIIAAVLIPAIIIIILIIIVVVLCQKKMRKGTSLYYEYYHNNNILLLYNTLSGAVAQREYHELQQISIIDRIKLERINENDQKLRQHRVQSNCSLRDAIEFQLNATFIRGHVYYEFIHDIENVSKDKELIFVEKVI